jgi:hypothetical protein
MMAPTFETRSVRPELVEGLSFLAGVVGREGQGFDRLSPNGGGLVGRRFSSLGARG